jgi:membrane protease YdiL (CAAX protease family)
MRDIIFALAVVVVGYFGGLLLNIVGISLVGGLDVTEQSNPAVFEAVGAASLSLGMGAATLVYLDWRSEGEILRARLPNLRDVGMIALGFVVVLLFGIILNRVAILFGIELAENVAIETGREHPELFLYYIPISILLVGPAEELLFRGAVQGFFRRSFGVAPGIVLASILFGLVHIPALVGSGSQLGYVGIAVGLGLILGALYEYSGNILVPALAHGIYNASIYVVEYLDVTGGL